MALAPITSVAGIVQLDCFVTCPTALGGLGLLPGPVANCLVSTHSATETLGLYMNGLRSALARLGDPEGDRALVATATPFALFSTHSYSRKVALRDPTDYSAPVLAIDSRRVKKMAFEDFLLTSKNPECRELAELLSCVPGVGRTQDLEDAILDYMATWPTIIPSTVTAITSMFPSYMLIELIGKLEYSKTALDLVRKAHRTKAVCMCGDARVNYSLRLQVYTKKKHLKMKSSQLHSVPKEELISTNPVATSMALSAATSLGQILRWWQPVCVSEYHACPVPPGALNANDMVPSGCFSMALNPSYATGFVSSGTLPLWGTKAASASQLMSGAISAKLANAKLQNYIRAPDMTDKKIQCLILLVQASYSLARVPFEQLLYDLTCTDEQYERSLSTTTLPSCLIPVVRQLARVWGLPPEMWLPRMSRTPWTPIAGLRSSDSSVILGHVIEQSIFGPDVIDTHMPNNPMSYTIDEGANKKAAVGALIPELTMMGSSLAAIELLHAHPFRMVSLPKVAERVPSDALSTQTVDVLALLRRMAAFPSNVIGFMHILSEQKLIIHAVAMSEASADVRREVPTGVTAASSRAITIPPMIPPHNGPHVEVKTFDIPSSAGMLGVTCNLSFKMSPTTRAPSAVDEVLGAIGQLIFMPGCDASTVVAYSSTFAVQSGTVKRDLSFSPKGLLDMMAAYVMIYGDEPLRDGPVMQGWYNLLNAAGAAIRGSSYKPMSVAAAQQATRRAKQELISFTATIGGTQPGTVLPPRLSLDVPPAVASGSSVACCQSLYRLYGVNELCKSLSVSHSGAIHSHTGAAVPAIARECAGMSAAMGFIACADALATKFLTREELNHADPLQQWSLSAEDIRCSSLAATVLSALYEVYPRLESIAYYLASRDDSPGARQLALSYLQGWKMTSHPMKTDAPGCFYTPLGDVGTVIAASNATPGVLPTGVSSVCHVFMVSCSDTDKSFSTSAQINVGWLFCSDDPAVAQHLTGYQVTRRPGSGALAPTPGACYLCVLPRASAKIGGIGVPLWTRLVNEMAQYVFAVLMHDLGDRRSRRIWNNMNYMVRGDDTRPPMEGLAYDYFIHPSTSLPDLETSLCFRELMPSSFFWAPYPVLRNPLVEGPESAKKVSLTYPQTMRDSFVLSFLSHVHQNKELFAELTMVNSQLTAVADDIVSEIHESQRVSKNRAFLPQEVMPRIIGQLDNKSPLGLLPMGWGTIFPINVTTIDGTPEPGLHHCPQSSICTCSWLTIQNARQVFASPSMRKAAQVFAFSQSAVPKLFVYRSIAQCFFSELDGSTLVRHVLPRAILPLTWERYLDLARGHLGEANAPTNGVTSVPPRKFLSKPITAPGLRTNVQPEAAVEENSPVY